ncbi:MAG TPA: hypothetical protein V6C81_23420 [Planktothrix sp.]|jgi:hypothetical protein
MKPKGKWTNVCLVTSALFLGAGFMYGDLAFHIFPISGVLKEVEDHIPQWQHSERGDDWVIPAEQDTE